MMIRSAPPCSANLAVMPVPAPQPMIGSPGVQRGPQAPQRLSAWDIRHARGPFVRVRVCWQTCAKRPSSSKPRPLVLRLHGDLRESPLVLESGSGLHPLPSSPIPQCSPPRLAFGKGLAVEVTLPATTDGLSRLQGTPFFTLSKGRGRIGRLRPNSVRGLPGRRPPATQRPPRGKSWRERSSGTHPRLRKDLVSGAACLRIVSPGTPAACPSSRRQRPRR